MRTPEPRPGDDSPLLLSPEEVEAHWPQDPCSCGANDWQFEDWDSTGIVYSCTVCGERYKWEPDCDPPD